MSNGMPKTKDELLNLILDAIDGDAVPAGFDANGMPEDTLAILAKIANALAARQYAQALSIADLADVAITEPSDGDVLTYDAESGKWKNTAADPVLDAPAT